MKQLKLFRVFYCLLAIVFSAMTAAAIEKDTDGYYLIGSTADFEEFCDLVNTGNPFASARVTADGINVTRSIGSGERMFYYRGKFDGQGHTLTVTEQSDNGIFAHTEAGCEIRNVNVTGTSYLSAIVYEARGTTLENCHSDATINGRYYITPGGLIALSRGPVTLINCSFSGEIHAAETGGGLIGHIDHTAYISDCQVTGQFDIAANIDESSNFVENTYVNGELVTRSVDAPSGEGDDIIKHLGVKYQIKQENGNETLTLLACNSSIKAIKIPNTITRNGKEYPVTIIGDNSMSYRKLEYLMVPSNVTRIGNNAFHYSESLRDVVFLDSDTKLWLGEDDDFTPDQDLFYACPVERVYIGRNLAWNGGWYHDAPFDTHSSIREIDFGPRVTVVGNVDEPNCHNSELFNECEKVESYAFLGDEKSLGTSIKFHCAEGMSHAGTAYISRDLEPSNYTEYTTLASGYAISDKTEHATYGPFATYVTPKMYSGSDVLDNSYLYEVDLTNATRLTTIGERAFADCDQMRKIDMFNTNVKNIDKEAFYDCDNLHNVTFSTTLENVGESAFNGSAIAATTLPGTLQKLGYKAFYDCDYMTSLTINPGKDDIICEDSDGECRTFDSCSELTRLYLGKNMIYKEGSEKASPFYDSYFQQVVIDNEVTQLGQYMFQHSNRLKSMSIGSGIKEIPNNCFNETDEVTQFNIVDCEEPITLGNSCRSFKANTMYVGRNINDPDNIPSGGNALQFLQYGKFADRVGSNSYANCSQLKSVILPPNTTLESNAFVNCGIQEMYIQGDATFQSEAIKNCNNFEELTVVGKLTLDENAFMIPDNGKAIKIINVFFREDPKDESHANAIPQKYLDETTLNNLYDTPYQNVEFSCMPWTGFKNRNSFSANDYTPSSEVIQNGKYDHAYIHNEHKAGKYFSIYMPFDVSTYYFGTDATAYPYVNGTGFSKETTEGATTLSALNTYELENRNYFENNIPFIVKSNFDDNLVGGAFDQFKSSQINVEFTPNTDDSAFATPYFVSSKDEVISPSMGNLYVIDNGCLKQVNGDYNLAAFSVAFKPGDGNELHFRDSNGETLIPESTDVTASPDLYGYVTYYNSECSFSVKGAKVYTVSQTTEKGVTVNQILPVKDNVVSQGQGVLIKYLAGETLTMNMVTNPSSDTEAYQNNLLKGVDVDTPVGDLGEIYVLSKLENSVGFFPYSNPSLLKEEGVLPAHHAYIDAREIDSEIPIIPLPTGIDDVTTDDTDTPTYDILGRRVYKTENGTLYIKRGEKFIKK